jgi:hypothetical protein
MLVLRLEVAHFSRLRHFLAKRFNTLFKLIKRRRMARKSPKLCWGTRERESCCTPLLFNQPRQVLFLRLNRFVLIEQGRVSLRIPGSRRLL